VIRYEDMLERPMEIFGKASAFFGLEDDRDQIARAVRLSSFAVLKKLEEQKRFQETPIDVPSFFRQGKSGNYREALTFKQIEKIILDHGSVMARFGYDAKAEA